MSFSRRTGPSDGEYIAILDRKKIKLGVFFYECHLTENMAFPKNIEGEIKLGVFFYGCHLTENIAIDQIVYDIAHPKNVGVKLKLVSFSASVI